MSAAADRLEAMLDKADRRGLRIPVWWRDDDAVTATPALERLLALAGRYDLPLALAVIPAGADAALASRIRAASGRVAVLQHGFAHRLHSPPGARKAELGDHRPADVMLGELREGARTLRELFAERFLPVLVPPWNRTGPKLAARIGEAGLVRLSSYGPATFGAGRQVNTHLDIFAWKPQRRPLCADELFAMAADAVAARLAGVAEPLGILTHHLVHDETAWTSLESLIARLVRHRSAAWPAIADLFAIDPVPP